MGVGEGVRCKKVCNISQEGGSTWLKVIMANYGEAKCVDEKKFRLT